MPRTNIHNPIEAPSMLQSGWYRWGMLFVIILLLVFCATTSELASSTRPRLESYSSTAVPLMLLFNHVASAFQWRPHVSVALNMLAAVGVAVGIVWVVWSIRQENQRHEQRRVQRTDPSPE